MKCHVSANANNRLRAEWSHSRQEPDHYSSGSRILIVDDDASRRFSFRVALEAAGYEATEAEDGERALEKLRADPADLVLLDLRMPRLDGPETLRCLMEERIDVPVVIVTAHGSAPNTVEAMSLGAIDYLNKPVDPATLRQTVTRALVSRTSHNGRPDRLTDLLVVASKALRQGHYSLAETLVQRAIEIDPGSPHAHTLLGAIHESVGEIHSAYQCYRTALLNDRYYGPALDGMRRYCDCTGLDFKNTRINPGA